MKVSKILNALGIEYLCNNIDAEFEALGLAGYNKGSKVCTFIENESYIKDLTKNISIILTTKEVAELFENNTAFDIYVVKNPRLTYFLLHNYLAENIEYIRPLYDTKIGKKCSISSHAVIAEKNVTIGENVIIEEFVIIRENTRIGNNTIIRAGSILGGEGFEFKKNDDNVFRVKHVGGVLVGNNVEIQYNSCIDKAIYPWDDTIINDYVKIDNLVHIGHAVKIGKRGMIVANSGIGGRVTIGEDAWVGFGTTIRNGVTIGDRARANMGAVVTTDIGDDKSFTGNFAIPHKDFIANMKLK